jgi:putative ABC transport system ATP-binding protein
LGAGIREPRAGRTARRGRSPAASTSWRRLSGGQRVASPARWPTTPPLLADEPTGALDSDSAQRVLDLLQDVRARRGMMMLVVTYDPLISDRADSCTC